VRSRAVLGTLGVVAIVGFLAYGATAFRSNLTPYVGFEQARSSPGTVQVAGKLVAGSDHVDAVTGSLVFTIQDDRSDTMRVSYHGAVPGNFKEATLVVAVGRYKDGRLDAENLLVKCPSKYQGLDNKKTGAS
jgi:cytochrome c-type biogenesis protein CcmE